jgi:hypothetical protein
VPDTLAPPAVKVKVFAPAEVLIVAGFIALLNVAVIMGALLGQTRVPFGVTESTVGAAVGEVAPPPTSGSPHPAIATANRNAGIQILLTFNLRISFSSSPCCKAFHTAHTRPDIYETSIFIGCSTKDTIHQQLHQYCNFGIFTSVQY